MTPQEIALQLAGHYRAYPFRWVRHKMGTLDTSCCMMGGALGIVSADTEASNIVAQVRGFNTAFFHMFGMTVTCFNDVHARDVNEVIAALDKLAANDAGA